MGTLNDITSQATNTIKRRSNASMGYQTLQSPASEEKENLAKSRSPHFMTPTFSSSKQFTATKTRNNETPSAPVASKPIKADSSNAWMKTAAKRVGFNRTAVTPRSMPRSKKEVQKHMAAINAISFPDKV